MPPVYIGADLAGATLTHHQTMEESLFPPISRKSAISIGSETDPSDFCNSSPHERKVLTTRGSVPALSLSSSPVKFPTIDRANSTSIASLPGSRAMRHRNMTRELRSSYCRSPSCPSHLDMNRTNVEFNSYNKRHSNTDQESSDVGSTDVEEKVSKLPSIFSSKNPSDRYERDESPRRDKNRDKLNALSLRRSESLLHAFHSNSDSKAQLSSRDADQRQSQTAALLLPLRTNPTVNNKKKKKRRTRRTSDSESEPRENTPRNHPETSRKDPDTSLNIPDSSRNLPDTSRKYADVHKQSSKQSCDTDDALNAIARENDLYDEEMDATPRAIEISPSRKVKQWINNNQKEGHIKA
ncbi:uncharacterized protein LOC128207634 [Mya arenaria]|uniref:uncharacterized protein LOC128207634 n=1 Tax=Mya arenaria TaxID=6604 RepID=UPI0022E296C4|nr:uncharacterized protein LOC128207634 [Mya arenaria]XP_052766631.1 uncharacterized protein LOC128207634 [Mya arenaria]